MKMGEEEQLEAAKQISAHITKAGKGDVLQYSLK
jgi:hypothetical protein